MTATIPLAGFVNSHSHAFQRALRGRAAGTDFWTWRDGMLEEADKATPDSVRAHYADVYREMRAAGYTAVGEFHYLGAAEAFAAAEAAATPGSRSCCSTSPTSAAASIACASAASRST